MMPNPLIPLHIYAEELHRELEAYFNEHHQSGDNDKLLIPATFLRVTVLKAG